MNVILINEEWHGQIGVAANYLSAIDFLIKDDWLFDKLEVDYDEKEKKYISLIDRLGKDWKETVENMNRTEFNDFFEDIFYLDNVKVYNRYEREEK